MDHLIKKPTRFDGFAGAVEGLVTLSRKGGVTLQQQAAVLAAALGRVIGEADADLDERLAAVAAEIEREAKLRMMARQAAHAGITV